MDSSEKIEPKILIIVGHALYEPWKSILYKGQLKTWAVNQDVAIYHTYANPVWKYLRQLDAFFWKLKWRPRFGKYFTALELILKIPFLAKKGSLIQECLPGTTEPSLRLKMPDLDMLMNFKSFGLITGTLAFDYDYLVSTTTSSYLNIGNLKLKISKLPRRKVIGGRVITQDSLKFASGSFRIFSRDIVEQFVIHRKRFSTWRPEDQAFGFLAKDAGLDIEYVEMDSLDIDSMTALDKLTCEDLLGIVHYRLKSGTLSERGDTEIMLKLHEKLAACNSATDRRINL